MSNQYLTGTLVAVGQPDEGRPPRAEVILTQEHLRNLKTLPMYETVCLVPVTDLELTDDERAAMERLQEWAEFGNKSMTASPRDARIILSALARLTGGAT